MARPWPVLARIVALLLLFSPAYSQAGTVRRRLRGVASPPAAVMLSPMSDTHTSLFPPDLCSTPNPDGTYPGSNPNVPSVVCSDLGAVCDGEGNCGSVLYVPGHPEITDPSQPVPGNDIIYNEYGNNASYILTGDYLVLLDPIDGLSLFINDNQTRQIYTYTIYYGAWGVTELLEPDGTDTGFYSTQQAEAIPIIEDFISNIGDSDWWQITQTYCVEDICPGKPYHDMTNPMMYAADPTYAFGTNWTDDTPRDIILSLINNGSLAFDATGVYMLLVDDQVLYPGFCDESCGIHVSFNVTPVDDLVPEAWDAAISIPNGELNATYIVAYIIVGSPGTYCSSCTGAPGAFADYDTNALSIGQVSYSPTLTPNGNFLADALASVIAHELSETVTDPGTDAVLFPPNAASGFIDGTFVSVAGEDGVPQGQECADKCANNWDLVDFKDTPDGSGTLYTNQVGDRYYNLQANWLPVTPPGGDHQVGCVSSVPPRYAELTYELA